MDYDWDSEVTRPAERCPIWPRGAEQGPYRCGVAGAEHPGQCGKRPAVRRWSRRASAHCCERLCPRDNVRSQPRPCWRGPGRSMHLPRRRTCRSTEDVSTMSSLSPALVSDDPGAQARSVTLDRAAAEIVVAPASRAPSLHNTQPWQWRLADGALDLRADRSRQLHVADPDGPSLLISCGAAAELTQLALAALGWAADTILLPEGGDPDLLARFHVRSRREPDPVAARDIAAAGRRRSERRVFGSRPVLSQAIEALRVAAQASGVFADFASSEEESVRGKPDAEPAALTAKRRPVDDVRTITPAAAAG